jgi:hypothetical protein
MRKVGILTFHAAYNYGAVLQAYALKEKIKSLGYDCRIINFRTKKQIKKYSVINTSKINKATLAKNIQNIFYAKQIKKRNSNFEKFIGNSLDVYPKNWIDEESLENTIKEFDFVVCGSDQIWNISEKVDDKSMCYFLDYKGNFKKISYAASFGDSIKDIEEEKERFLPLLKDFSNISVRENDAQEFLNGNGIISELTLDPTLLMNKEEWKKVIKDVKINEPYILYYSVNSRKYSIDLTKRISKELGGIKVINLVLHPKSAFSGFENKIDYAPEEFLALINNAKMICTNSFHGTVFSIIFEKPFVAMFDMKDEKIVKEQRKYTLLKELGLEDRIYTSKSEINIQEMLKVNYKESKERLERLRNKSLKYIKESLK